MIICYDNLEKYKIHLTKGGNFRGKNGHLVYYESCKICKEPYFGQVRNKGCCGHKCSIILNERMSNTAGEQNGFYGKKHSEKSIDEIRQSHLGKSTKGYNYPDRTGKNNSNWKGGISENRKYYRSKKYQNWRNAVFEKDNYTCWHCNQIGGKLHAHHIYESSKFPQFRYDVSNGITLSEKYHRSIRTKELEFRKIYYGWRSNAKENLCININHKT